MKEIDHELAFNIQKQKDGAELTRLYVTGVLSNLPEFYFLVIHGSILFGIYHYQSHSRSAVLSYMQ